MKALIALLLLVSLCGCSTFRALFDETPEETAARRNRAAAAAAGRQRSAAPGETKEFRDPVADLLRIRRSKPAPVAAGFDLTEEERRVLENSLSDTAAPSAEEEAFRRRVRESQQKNEAWVFGGNPFKESKRE